jgi:hypothetical protein
MCGAVLIATATGCGDKKSEPIEWNVGTVVETCGRGVLARVETGYGPLQIVRVQGTHYEMGYQYGCLLADQMASFWDFYVVLAAQELEADPELAEDLMNMYLDQAWGHMEPFTPQPYKDELQGVEDGARDSGKAPEINAGEVARRFLMLADVSQADEFGDMSRMGRFFREGYSESVKEYFGIAQRSILTNRRHAYAIAQAEMQDKLGRDFRLPKMACSFFAVWGHHTDGRLMASRMLDWEADLGLKEYALLTLFVPDGGIPHLTVGYVGYLGALAGMNTHGIVLGGVGSTSALARLKAEPGLLKTRELLEFVAHPDEADRFIGGDAGDGLLRPNSIGANAMVAWGDPEGGGAGASAGAMENNGIFTSVFKHHPDCTEEALLYEFDLEGDIAFVYDHTSDPNVVNLEGDACEIDATGNVRTFQVDANDHFVRDGNGDLIDDPTGLPYPVGLPIPCAVFRGDEAMAYGVRRWQLTAHGPRSNSDDKQMHRSGTYVNRYQPQHDMIQAYNQGTEFQWDGQVVIPDNGGVPVPIGPQEGIVIARVAAMGSNVYSVIYDATNLELWVAYESGTGDNWTRAADNPHFRIRLEDLLP